MTNFCKNEDCPTSEELLDFQNGDMALSEGPEIRQHLKNCEFCAAEVAFYSHYPPAAVRVEPAKMPKPLFELAEAILSKKKDDLFFDSLMKEDISILEQ